MGVLAVPDCHQHPVSVDTPCHGRGSGHQAPPRIVGLLVADLHINPVDGGRCMVVGVALMDHGLWTLWPFPHWLFVALAH